MQTNPQNKREKIISLTTSGQVFAQALIQPLFQYEEEAATMLDEKEMAAAITIQNQFADTLLQKVQPPTPFVPSLLGQVKPALIEIFCIRAPKISLRCWL